MTCAKVVRRTRIATFLRTLIAKIELRITRIILEPIKLTWQEPPAILGSWIGRSPSGAITIAVCLLQMEWVTGWTRIRNTQPMVIEAGVDLNSSIPRVVNLSLLLYKETCSMPASRLPLRKVKYILQMWFEDDFSIRTIALYAGVGRTTVARMLERAEKAQLTWPLPSDMTDTMLKAVLYPNSSRSARAHRPVPNWAEIHSQLSSQRSLTVAQLWQRYITQHPNGFRYSHFCGLYRAWRLREGIK